MTERYPARSLLRRALDDPTADFREGQWEAIDLLVNRRRKIMVVQRTGWGKSAVYFIATRILRDQGRGPTLIISPLLALMRNQIDAARRLSITAVTINSTNKDNWPELVRSIHDNTPDALLISPERLANDEFVSQVLEPVADRIGLLVVDEAHCISDWGHDFRPDYRRLMNVLRRMPPNMPVLGVTATANNRVVDDVTSQLGDMRVLRGPLMRETLALQTLRLPDQPARLAWLAEHVPHLPGTGIVYVLTKWDANQVSDWLNQNGVTARAYYSDVCGEGFEDSNGYRQHLEGMLLNNELKALVATTALGMGYDKPDLGFVIHYQAPGSIVGYYQQVGRAGRGIDRAVGILMSGREDGEIHAYFRKTAFPGEAQVNSILDALGGGDGLSVLELEAKVNLRRGQIEKVLKFLSVDHPAPVMMADRKWVRTPVEYEMDHAKIQRLTRQRESEWQEVQTYIDTPECLMVFLARELDDETAGPCGKCARCLGRPVVPESYDHARAAKAALHLRRAELPLECKKQAIKGSFEQYGFPTTLPEKLRARTGRILSRWGDAGWGQLVADDKHAGDFRDGLVDAVAEMVRDRWKPDPAPAWVTCVPSLRHPELVPSFSRRLASRLGLPFLPAVAKMRDNQPQKTQQNRYYQCRNLDGVFSVEGDIPDGPVLLVDDMVDSAWTMTVVAALLLQAGSGPVWPVALATTAAGD